MQKITAIAAGIVDQENKQAQKLANTSVTNLEKARTDSGTSGMSHRKVMNHLWLTMNDIYSTSFTNKFGSSPNKSWAAIFSSMRYTDIEYGFDRLRSHDSRFKTFPPGPWEFRDLCNPKPMDYGLPSEPEAFKIAANWKNDSVEKIPAVLHAIRQLDFYSWSMLPTEKAKKEFSRAWTNTVLHVMEGGKLEPIIAKENRLEQKPLSKDEKLAMSGKLAEFRRGLRSNRK